MITFGVVKSSIYNNPEKAYASEVFIKIDNEESVDLSIVSDNIQTVLSKVSEDAAGTKSLKDSFDSPVLFDFDILEYDSNEDPAYKMHCYAAYIVKVNTRLPEKIYYEGTEYKVEDFFSSESTTVVQDAIGNTDAIKAIEYANGVSATEPSPNAVKVIIATGSALAATALYLLLRYRLSRGLGALITTLAGATFVAGIYSILYFIAATNIAVIGAVIGEFACFAFAILFMDKEKELVLDDKKHDNSYENRNEIMKKAVSYGMGDILNVAIACFLAAVCFLAFGPGAMFWVSLEICIAVAVAFALAMFVLGPVSQFFFKKFANVGQVKPRKAKSKGPVQNKSAEPEEAIFIGIND